MRTAQLNAGQPAARAVPCSVALLEKGGEGDAEDAGEAEQFEVSDPAAACFDAVNGEAIDVPAVELALERQPFLRPPEPVAHAPHRRSDDVSRMGRRDFHDGCFDDAFAPQSRLHLCRIFVPRHRSDDQVG